MNASELTQTKALAGELQKVIDGWTGAPLDPVVVEARQLVQVAHARILQAEVLAAVKGGG